jgi:hypothetical protein
MLSSRRWARYSIIVSRVVLLTSRLMDENAKDFYSPQERVLFVLARKSIKQSYRPCVNLYPIGYKKTRKSIKQSYRPSPAILSLMQSFKQITNDCIRIGLTNEILKVDASKLANREDFHP